MAGMTEKRTEVELVSCLDLRNVIRKLSSAFEGRACDSPSARNIKFGNGRAMLSGKGVTVTVQCGVRSEFLAPYENLSKIAMLTDPNARLKITPAGGGCKVESEEHKWVLVCDPSWTDQNPPKGQDRPLFRIPTDEFVRGFRSTGFARAKTGEAMSALHDIMLDVSDGSVSFVCSDGRRMALFQTEVDQAVDDAAVTMPARIVERVASIASRHEDDAVQFCYSQTQGLIELSDCSFRFALPVSTYPDWKRAMKGSDKCCCVEAGTFRDALNKAAVCCAEESHGVLLEVAGGSIRIAATGSGSSSAVVKLHHSESDCEATLNPAYLDQWLDSVDQCEPVHFDLCGTEAANAIFATEGRRYLVCRIEKP